jgi:hypothetical protein
MQLLERMFRNERTMRAIFGIGAHKFNELAERFGELYIEELASRKNRQRAVGGGRTGQLPSGRHKLAFILFYLKVYPTFDVLGVFCGIDAAECCRKVHKLMPVLEKLLGQKLMLPKRKIRCMEEFAAAFPQALEVIIDGTDRPVQRSKKNDAAQALLWEKEEAYAQGDCRCGWKAPHRLSVPKQKRGQA